MKRIPGRKRPVRPSKPLVPGEGIGRPEQPVVPGPKLGVALGGGAALGLAHIGVLRVFEENGIRPDIVAGTSIGAVVGAAYVFGQLERLEAAATKVSWLELMRLIDLRIGRGGLMLGEAIVKEVRSYIGEATFADADRSFAVMATDLVRDQEVILREGEVAAAIRASISLPGVFTPIESDGRLLVDGGIKNPVPVSTCRKMGADKVIAVNVTGDYRGQARASGIEEGKPFAGGFYEVVSMTMASIMQRLAQANFVTDPPDLTIVPEIGHLKPFKFNEGEQLIAAGREAALARLDDIRALCGQER